MRLNTILILSLTTLVTACRVVTTNKERMNGMPVLPTAVQPLSSIGLLKTIEIDNMARPEIVVTSTRVFVIYLEAQTQTSAFKVKVYDKDLTAEIFSKTLITTSTTYGKPTDVRVISDGTSLYAFYETATNSNAYLWGAKYTLDDQLTPVVSDVPIATSVHFSLAQNGDEKLDDPAPMIQGNNVYVMTRYKSSYTEAGETRYKIYQLDKDLNQMTQFVLDLSAYANGGARQSSILYDNGYFYIVLPTTLGTGTVIESAPLTAPADILMVKLDQNWIVQDSRIIASEPNYTEGYVTGLKADDNHFYITYNQLIFGKEFSSVIKIYDKNWEPIVTESYRTITSGSLRPSLDVFSDRVYAANEYEGQRKSQISIFEKQ